MKSKDELVEEVMRAVGVKKTQGAPGPTNLPTPPSPLVPPISPLHKEVRPKTVPQAEAWTVNLKQTGPLPCWRLW